MIRLTLCPQIRLFITLCLTFCVALLTRLEFAALAFAFAILALALSDTRFKDLRKRLFAVNIFLVFVWALVPFTAPGHPCGDFCGFPISETGLLLSALVTLKCNAIFLLFCVCMESTTMGTLARAMTGLRFPNKLVTLLMLTVQQLSGFSRAKKRLAEAAALRGFRPCNNIRTYRTYGAMLGLLLLRVLKESNLMREALLLRSFHGQWPKHHIVPAGRSEKLLASILMLCCILLLYVDRS